MDFMSQCHEAIGSVNLKREDFPEAEASLRKALEMSPNPTPFTMYSLATALSKQGKNEEASEMADRCSAGGGAMSGVGTDLCAELKKDALRAEVRRASQPVQWRCRSGAGTDGDETGPRDRSGSCRNAWDTVFGTPRCWIWPLTHGSASSAGGVANQGLEYLGDARARDWRFPKPFTAACRAHPREDLTNLKARYVCNPQLAAVARSLGLGPCLRMGKAEDRQGGREKDRCLADAMEAVIGALYLDGGMAAVGPIVDRFVVAEEPTVGNSAKTELQEWLQSRGRKTPRYVVVHETGPSHYRNYLVEARCGSRVGRGQGYRKKKAEERAAADVLAQLVRSEAPSAIVSQSDVDR